MKIVIVGGVAGGASAAARARRLSEDVSIVVFERGSDVSFANCGLPYHIGGKIPLRQSLILKTPEDFKSRFNIDVRICHEVTSVDPVNKTVTVKNLTSGEVYSEEWDRLLLSTGAAPVVPPLPGLQEEGVFTLRNLTDMDAILGWIEQHHVAHTTLVGGGFIGLEVMEALSERGISVTLLEMGNRLWLRLILKWHLPCIRKSGVMAWICVSERRSPRYCGQRRDSALHCLRVGFCRPTWLFSPSG